jgi:hypothetical protein
MMRAMSQHIWEQHAGRERPPALPALRSAVDTDQRSMPIKGRCRSAVDTDQRGGGSAAAAPPLSLRRFTPRD